MKAGWKLICPICGGDEFVEDLGEIICPNCVTCYNPATSTWHLPDGKALTVSYEKN